MDLLGLASQIYNGYSTSQLAKQQAASDKAAAKLAAANASAEQAKSSSMTKIALIGGGLIAVIVVLALVMKRKG